ncbi:MAG: serine hydrolase domain-containing protein [Actinomycetota bacterium]
MDAAGSLERIRGFVARRQEHLATPGLALAVTDRDRCLGVIADGLASVEAGRRVAAHHRFQIGSISKGFTALAILQQVEEGRVDLDAPVTEYLPWFEVRTAHGPITIHHLLSHTSGLVTGSDFAGDAAPEVWSLRETETGFAPGERFLYSNAGYKTLGLVLGAVTGEPWWELVRRRVMLPIGMGDAEVVITDRARARLAVGHGPPRLDRPWFPRHGWAATPWFESATADGTICATAEELTAYARLLLAGGAGVVATSSFEQMTTPFAEDLDTPGDRYGYGVKLVDDGNDRRLLGHSGGMIGFTALLLVDVGSGFGVIALMNSGIGRRVDLVRFALACLAAESSGAPLPEIPEPPDPYRIDGAPAFEGRYSDDAGEVAVRSEDPGLVLESAGHRGPLALQDGDVFAVDHPELERYAIRFLREDGAVTGAFWGSRWLRHEGSPAPAESACPPEWSRYPGRYASWNPWAPGFRVFLRRDQLWLAMTGDASDVDGEHRLTPLEDGSFRFGEPWSPDHVRFDWFIDGMAQRAVFDAAPFYRTFAP